MKRSFKRAPGAIVAREGSIIYFGKSNKPKAGDIVALNGFPVNKHSEHIYKVLKVTRCYGNVYIWQREWMGKIKKHED